jgi:hypothetical protein
MARELNIIDADAHVLEPLNLWHNYIDPQFRTRAAEIHRH